MESIISFLNLINDGIDIIAAVIFVVLLFFAVIWYTVGKIQSYIKKGDEPIKGVFLGVIALIEALIAGYLIVQFPATLEKISDSRLGLLIKAESFRWAFLYFMLPISAYFFTRKYSGWRGFFATVLILSISLLGWFFERWIGILLISVPIYALLLIFIFHLAQAVLPACNPEDRRERLNKFKAVLFYILGVQYPLWAVKETAAREIEMCIPGGYFNRLFEPGVVTTHSHQVVGMSAGVEFNEVQGPGILFTKSYDRPVAVVDLRNQLRVGTVEATTRDGMSVTAIIFIGFSIDREDWPKKKWTRQDLTRLEQDCKINPLLREGLRLDRQIGLYSYSTARVKSVLSTAGIDTTSAGKQAHNFVYWDEWVVKQVENAARQVISQRKVDELWKPINNIAGKGALDEIAAEIQKNVEPSLRRVGIDLFAARVVNYALPEKSPIRKQQIESWKTIWTQKISEIDAEAEAIHKEEIEKAHAYAKSEILDAIAESIERARAENKELPRHVIALYFIHAIEDIMHRRPSIGSAEAQKQIDSVKEFLLYNS